MLELKFNNFKCPDGEIGRQVRIINIKTSFMSKRKWTNEQFILAVETSLSYAEVIRKLGLKPAGSNYDTVKRKIKELDLNISHMTGKVWNIGKRYKKNKNSIANRTNISKRFYFYQFR